MGRPIHGPKTEPAGHVLDLHDIEAVAGALIAAARADIEHESRVGVSCRWDGVKVRTCDRGGHFCPGCYMTIWDCARTFLNGLAVQLQDYPAGELHNLLDAADHAEKS